MSLVELIEHTRDEYVLLTPEHCPPRTGSNFNLINPVEHLDDILTSISNSPILAVDFETRGVDYSDDDFEIIGIGLAWDEGSCYFDREALPYEQGYYLFCAVEMHKGLIAHNVYFDGGVFNKAMGKHPNWHMCTYSLYSFLANEGFAGRGWSLKTAQVELLLWENSNEGELDEWLVLNGYYIGNRRLDSTEDYLRAEYLSGNLRPNKGEMWRAPVEILGKYCILDAESTYLLYNRILSPKLGCFPGLQEFMRDEWMPLIRILIDQKMHGIEMDREGLTIRKNLILAESSSLGSEFMNHEQTRKHIEDMQEEMICEGILAKEPARYKKNGDLSKNWTKWNQRLTDAREGRLPEYQFNLNSGPQLRELLYDRIGLPVKITTEKGEASTSIKALRSMGGIGSILVQRMWLVKELSFVEKYLELTTSRNSIHPSFRAPGTTTGRLSSKEPNLQQVPKSKSMMSLFVARPGHVWVDLDFSALEPVVATEFSEDPNMMRIYGNGVPANDIYIFVMAHIPGMGERARALGYDPYNPTPSSLAAVKKEMKKERSICKTVVLACQYGAGVNKVHQTLEQDEIYLEYHEVEKIHSGYWDLFAKVKDFSRSLWYEWRRNKGHILNGIGRPMAVPEEMTKDILNRFIQSTGHDILIKYINILTRNLTAAGVPWKPIIIDFHDATTVEVPEQYVEQTVDIFNRSMLDLNNVLQGTIKLRGVPTVGRTLADVKEPEE